MVTSHHTVGSNGDTNFKKYSPHENQIPFHSQMHVFSRYFLLDSSHNFYLYMEEGTVAVNGYNFEVLSILSVVGKVADQF